MSTVLVYADRADVRERVKAAIGTLPDPRLGEIEFVDVSDGRELVDAVDHGEADLCVLDAEATPEGGMGLSRQLKNEVADCPPTVLLVARADDRWLATWSLADAVVTHPVDPDELTAAVVGLLLARRSGLPVRRPVTYATHPARA
ncbi:MAG: response regulator transcription factor [Frankia sp.]|nr:response regulator transcription factor [Frankia sp.]